jgi:tRNA threonylcarbamoyladenosine biosynthesis protein TsaB
MASIIIIDTTGNRGYAALSVNGQLLECIVNTEPQNHAAFVQPAIQQILTQNGISWPKIQAIAVSNGPGSYTGLRVGLASAKGLCYALGIPLITLPTLQLMAMSSMANTGLPQGNDYWYCPMIDARRMEVFYALYNARMMPLISPANAVIDEHWLSDTLAENIICFSGSGSHKFQTLTNNPRATFAGEPPTEISAASLAEQYFKQSMFANLAYAEPMYIKAFYSTAKPKT